MKAVGNVGLRLNADKRVILTNEAQPPNTLVTKDGLISSKSWSGIKAKNG